MAEFRYQPLIELGEDKTEYYLLTKDYVSVSEFEGKPILKVEKEGLTANVYLLLSFDFCPTLHSISSALSRRFVPSFNLIISFLLCRTSALLDFKSHLSIRCYLIHFQTLSVGLDSLNNHFLESTGSVNPYVILSVLLGIVVKPVLKRCHV